MSCLCQDFFFLSCKYMYSVPMFCINATPISCLFLFIPDLSINHPSISPTFSLFISIPQYPQIMPLSEDAPVTKSSHIFPWVTWHHYLSHCHNPAQPPPLHSLSLFSCFTLWPVEDQYLLIQWASVSLMFYGLPQLWPGPLRGLWPLLLGDRGSVTKKRLRRCCWPEEAVMPGSHPIRAVRAGQSHSRQIRNNSNNNNTHTTKRVVQTHQSSLLQ